MWIETKHTECKPMLIASTYRSHNATLDTCITDFQGQLHKDDQTIRRHAHEVTV